MEKYDFYKSTGLKGGVLQGESKQGESNQGESNQGESNQGESNQVVQKVKIEFKLLFNYEENQNEIKTPKINLDNYKLMDFFR